MTEKLFAVLDVTANVFLKNESGEIQCYPSGELAKNIAIDLTQINGRKYQPRPYVKLTDDWQARERERFESGEYISVLPSLGVHCKLEHFVHVSIKDPAKLAYIRTPEDGAADRQKQISVRGYLEIYMPDLPQSKRDEIAEEHAEHFAARDLKFARTPDEIEEVYTNYANCGSVATSCMRYAADSNNFTLHMHPVRVYGAGDLAVAYIANEDGKTTARTLCWPERKVYTRVYGTNDTICKLHTLLQIQGYKKSCNWRDYGGRGNNFADYGLEGARVLRVQGKNYPNAYIAPYCDDVPYMAACDDKKYFVLSTHSGYSMRNTNGLTLDDDELEGPYVCEYCEEHFHESGDLTTVNVRGGTQEWCEYCRNECAFYCDGTNEYYSESFYSDVVINGTRYELEYARENYYKCEHCREWSTESLIEVRSSNAAQDVCPDCATERAFRCTVDGKLYWQKEAAPDTLSEEPAEDGYFTGRYIGNLAPDASLGEPYRCTDPNQGELPIAA